MNEPTNIDLIKMVRSILRIEDKRPHCQCRSGSPDTCPICTDMKTGENLREAHLDQSHLNL